MQNDYAYNCNNLEIINSSVMFVWFWDIYAFKSLQNFEQYTSIICRNSTNKLSLDLVLKLLMFILYKYRTAFTPTYMAHFMYFTITFN